MSAVPLPIPLADVLARGDVWRGDALARLPETTIPTGYPELDAELPGGGWPQGGITEMLTERSGIGEMGLLLPGLARASASGWLALVAPPWIPYAPAWAATGIVLGRMVVVRPARDVVWSIEQLLACGGFSAILAWPGQVETKHMRRLQVAVEGRSVLAFLWRSPVVARMPSPAPLRIALSAERGNLLLHLLKRRGRPAVHALTLPYHTFIPRPGRQSRAVAGATFSPVADRGAAATTLA